MVDLTFIVVTVAVFISGILVGSYIHNGKKEAMILAGILLFGAVVTMAVRS